jgi:hypothetical protein
MEGVGGMSIKAKKETVDGQTVQGCWMVVAAVVVCCFCHLGEEVYEVAVSEVYMYRLLNGQELMREGMRRKKTARRGR